MSVRPDTTTADLDALVEEHLYLVQHIVNQLTSRYPRHVDRTELWSAGAAGLVDAAGRFDPTEEVPFARYASIRIRGAIIDSTRARDWASRSLRRQARDLQAAERRLEQELARSPSRAELAEAAGLTVEQVETCQRGVQRSNLLQLDQPVSDPATGGATTLQSLLREHDAAVLPAEAAEQRELVGSLRVAVANLDEVHREVIVRHFFGSDLLRDIAADLGVTEARVSQIRSEGINAIRAYLGTKFEGIPEVPDSAPGRRRRATYLASMEHSTWRKRFDTTSIAAGMTC